MLFIQLIYLFSSFFSLDSSLPDEVCLSSEEQKLYDVIMEYRKEQKLKSIPYSVKLTQVAQAHVHDLVDNYDFAQRDMCNPHSWSDKGDWSSCCYTNDHKQASCMWDKPREIGGYDGDGYEIAYYFSAGATAATALAGWQKSKGHNPLLVNLGMWKEVTWGAIGIGIYKEYAVVWFGQDEDKSEIVSCE
jgi:uncharacterized protein YkwD